MLRHGRHELPVGRRRAAADGAADPAAAALPLVAALAERCAALRDERDALVARVEALEGELDGREEREAEAVAGLGRRPS